MFPEIRAGDRRGLAVRVGSSGAVRGKRWDGMGGVFTLPVPEGAPKQLAIKKSIALTTLRDIPGRPQNLDKDTGSRPGLWLQILAASPYLSVLQELPL